MGAGEWKFLYYKFMKFRLKIYFAIFIVLLAVGIIGFMLFENMSLTNAIYFSIVTMATVGYGDIHPQTEIGKILTIIIIIGGVGTFLSVVASITDVFVNRREEKIRKEKVNMVLGLFFSEMGNDLLKHFVKFDNDVKLLYKDLKVSLKWGHQDFNNAYDLLKKHHISINSHKGDLQAVFACMQSRSDLLLRLIENPIIQEHENFTELLRAIFHLRDELLHRNNLSELLDSDRKHLEGDISRVYKLLIVEWLRYLLYIKENYGYLFSLAVRTNPFDPDATVAVKN
nr:potassium channel family protein [Desulfobacter latus]